VELSDFFADPLLWFTVAIAVLLVAFIIYLRIRSRDTNAMEQPDPLQALDENVEYEWEVRPNVFLRVVAIVVIIAVGVLPWLEFIDFDAIFDNLGQFWFVGVWLISVLLGGSTQAFKCTLTTSGLVRQNLSNKKAVPEVLFLWGELVWIKPGPHGFKYFRRADSAAENPFEKLSEKVKISASNSRYVRVGDSATLVNSLIMSRGIPTSPPNKSESEGYTG